MSTLIAMTLSASAVLYVAKTQTFGCNSTVEVTELERARLRDAAEFEGLLTAQMVYGQCIAIEPGVVVEGQQDTDEKFLRIDARLNPPGVMVPSADFDQHPPLD